MSMNHGSTCHVLKVPDALISPTVLMMSANATVGDGLSICFHLGHKDFVGKPAIVAVVVKDLYSMGCGKTLKPFFGLNRGFSGESFMGTTKERLE